MRLPCFAHRRLSLEMQLRLREAMIPPSTDVQRIADNWVHTFCSPLVEPTVRFSLTVHSSVCDVCVKSTYHLTCADDSRFDLGSRHLLQHTRNNLALTKETLKLDRALLDLQLRAGRERPEYARYPLPLRIGDHGTRVQLRQRCQYELPDESVCVRRVEDGFLQVDDVFVGDLWMRCGMSGGPREPAS